MIRTNTAQHDCRAVFFIKIKSASELDFQKHLVYSSGVVFLGLMRS